MRTLGLLKLRSSRVKPNLIALAIASRQPDASLDGLDDEACLELFGVKFDGNTDWRNAWVLDADRCRISLAGGRLYLKLLEAARAGFVAHVPTQREIEAAT